MSSPRSPGKDITGKEWDKTANGPPNGTRIHHDSSLYRPFPVLEAGILPAAEADARKTEQEKPLYPAEERFRFRLSSPPSRKGEQQPIST